MRVNKTNEDAFIKRLAENFNASVIKLSLKSFKGPYTYAAYEEYLNSKQITDDVIWYYSKNLPVFPIYGHPRSDLAMYQINDNRSFVFIKCRVSIRLPSDRSQYPITPLTLPCPFQSLSSTAQLKHLQVPAKRRAAKARRAEELARVKRSLQRAKDSVKDDGLRASLQGGQGCHHASHAYTGIPCVAYSKLPCSYHRRWRK